jgi:hypothetical protein
MTTDGYCARFRGQCDRQLSWLVVVVPGQDGPLKRMWAKRIDQRIKLSSPSCGKFASSVNEKLVGLGIDLDDVNIEGEVTPTMRTDLRDDCFNLMARSNPDTATERVSGCERPR